MSIPALRAGDFQGIGVYRSDGRACVTLAHKKPRWWRQSQYRDPLIVTSTGRVRNSYKLLSDKLR